MKLNEIWRSKQLGAQARVVGQRSLLWLKSGQPCLHHLYVLRTAFSWQPLSSFSLWIIRLPQPSPALMESFRFEDEDEYEIFSILSSVRAWASVILAGKRDSRRHSTNGFRENIGVAGTSYQM